MKKKFLAYALTVAMLLGMLPTAAFAALTQGVDGTYPAVTPTAISVEDNGETRVVTVSFTVDNSTDAWAGGTVAGLLVTNSMQQVPSTAEVFDNDPPNETLSHSIPFITTVTGCLPDVYHTITLYDTNNTNGTAETSSTTTITFMFDDSLTVKNDWDDLPPSAAPTGTTTVTLSGAGTTDATGAVVSGSTSITLTASGTTFSDTGSYKWFGPDGNEITTGVSQTTLAGDTLTIASYTSAKAGAYTAKPYNTETGKGATVGEEGTFGTKTLTTTKINQPTAVTISGGTTATYGTNLQLSASGGDTAEDITWAVTSGNATINADGLLTPTKGTGSVVVTATRPGDDDYEDKDGTATIILSQKELSLTKTTLEGNVSDGATPVDLRTKNFVADPDGLKTLAEAGATLDFAVGATNNANITINNNKDLTWDTTLTEDKTSQITITMTANDYYTLASSTDAVTFTAKMGKETTADESGKDEYSVSYTGTLSGDLDSVASQLTAAQAAAGIKIMDGATDVTARGTWSWDNGGTTLVAGAHDYTLKWSGATVEADGKPYAPQKVNVTIYAKKQLTMADFTTNTITKKYDNTPNLPEDGSEVVALTAPVDPGSGEIALSVTVAGTYTEVGVGSGDKTITVTSLAAHDVGTATATDWEEYYILPAAPIANITDASITQGDAPALTLGNLSQTAGSVTDVTVTSNPASDDFVGVVEYKVPLALTYTVTATNCNCGAVEKSAHTDGCPAVDCNCGAVAGTPADKKHAVDCDYVTGQNSSACTCNATAVGSEAGAHKDGCAIVGCTCGATNAVAAATKHTDVCAYSVDPTDKCDCTIRTNSTLNTVADHTADCAAVVADTQTYEWKKFSDAPTDTTLGATVGEWLNSLAAGKTVDVQATSTASTNLAAQSTPVTGTLTIQSAYVPPTGGGSGVSSYTVRYEAGKNGALAKGSKTSESVKKGEKPVNVPEVVADEGYVFLGWTVKGSDDLVKPAETEITKGVTFVAVFAEKGDVHAVYVNGVGDGKFNPEGTMTRAEAAAMLARLHDEWTGEPGSTVFTDVPADAWYAAAVTFAADKGIIEGRGEGVFDPTASISRAEFAAMLCRFMGLETDGQSAGFSDTQGTWADAYITALKTAGVADGYVDGTFRPENPVARAEAVKLINGALGRTPDKDLVDENLTANPFTDVAADYWAYCDIMEAAVDHLGRDFHPAEKPAEK